jgi:hypothetical protein
VQHDHEALPAFSVQLLTAPSIARIVEARDSALSVIITTILHQLDPQTDEHNLLTYEGEDEDDRGLIASGRLQWLVHDVGYILTCAVPAPPATVLPPLLQLFSRIQYSVVDRRCLGAHIEFEAIKWVSGFNLLMTLGTLLNELPAAMLQSVCVLHLPPHRLASLRLHSPPKASLSTSLYFRRLLLNGRLGTWRPLSATRCRASYSTPLSPSTPLPSKSRATLAATPACHSMPPQRAFRCCVPFSASFRVRAGSSLVPLPSPSNHLNSCIFNCIYFSDCQR